MIYVWLPDNLYEVYHRIPGAKSFNYFSIAKFGIEIKVTKEELLEMLELVDTAHLNDDCSESLNDLSDLYRTLAKYED